MLGTRNQPRLEAVALACSAKRAMHGDFRNRDRYRNRYSFCAKVLGYADISHADADCDPDADPDPRGFFAHSSPERQSLVVGNSVYSTPVPANGVLYITTRTELYAIAGSAGGSER